METGSEFQFLPSLCLFDQHQLRYRTTHIEYGIVVTRFKVEGNSEIGYVMAIAAIGRTTETEHDLWGHSFGEADW